MDIENYYIQTKFDKGMIIDMRDYQKELENRVKYIRDTIKNANAKGIVFGNSGGKDSVLVGILCKKACDNVLGVMMPCQSKRNFGEDMEDAEAVAKQYNIDSLVIDLSNTKNSITDVVSGHIDITAASAANIAPRLRMITLYTIAQSKGYLVAGTGNRSERYMGYFTKWGDGACDFNPIADLTVGETYEFLKFLGVPANIIQKAPSAGLFEGQTDEKEMGVSYAAIDEYILHGTGNPHDIVKIDGAHAITEHKRKMPSVFGG